MERVGRGKVGVMGSMLNALGGVVVDDCRLHFPGARGSCALTSNHGRAEVGVAAGMFDQVVAAHETLVTKRAGEALLPSVRALVSRQLIRACELLLAAGPGAREGPLTCADMQRGR